MSIVYTDSKIIKRLYEFISKTHDILTKLEVPYFIFAGTLLGAVRHGEIIPWDDDIDIAVMEDFETKIWENRDMFFNAQLNITKYKFGYKVFALDSEIDQRWNHGYPFLDIFIMSEYTDENQVAKIHYKNKDYRLEFPNETFNKHDVFPLKPYSLNGISLVGPNKGEALLNKFYTDNWRTCYRTHDLCHVNKTKIQPTVISYI